MWTKGERCRMERVDQQKTSRGRLWAAFGVDGFLRKVWERFSQESVDQNGAGRSSNGDAVGNRRQLAEGVAVLRGTTCASMVLDGVRSFRAGKAGDWEQLLRNEELSEWASVMVRD